MQHAVKFIEWYKKFQYGYVQVLCTLELMSCLVLEKHITKGVLDYVHCDVYVPTR